MNDKQINSLLRMVKDYGPDVLFTKEAMHFTKGALAQLKIQARFGAAMVRMPGLRDKIPAHIREDILNQSYSIIEMLGRCSFVLLLFEGGHVEQDEPDLKRLFASMYNNVCDRAESLQKLCQLTCETYAEPGYTEKFNSVPDKEF